MLKSRGAMSKKAVVLHSGGMDSSLCLALAIREFGSDKVLSLGIAYCQRHQNELQCAKKICDDWGIQQRILDCGALSGMWDNALTTPSVPIAQQAGSPNTLVVGRNGLMVHLGGIIAAANGASTLYVGVLEREEANSGYRDCSRAYMDLQQQVLRIDLAQPLFEIRTPLVAMTKGETLLLAEQLGILEYLLSNTLTCYEGVAGAGCSRCPSCLLKQKGLQEFAQKRQAKHTHAGTGSVKGNSH